MTDVDDALSATYEHDRLAHLGALVTGLPHAIAARSWPRRRVLDLQEQRLRALLHHARTHSSWHADRLRSVDVDTFRVADIPAIPPMTKTDLMEHWDGIVTDPGLSLARAEEHLAGVEQHGPRYLDGTYHVARSSGTRGHQAVVLWDFDGWLDQALATYAVVASILLDTVGEQVPLRIASLAGGGDATHFSQAVGLCFSSPALSITTISPAVALDRILDELHAAQPTVLIGFPSMLEVLAHASERGELQIAPRWLGASGEPLYPDGRALVERAFGASLSETWGAAETGPLAFGVLGQPMELDEAMAAVEPVTEDGAPCPPGEASANTLVTNLVNKALPLIRYELGDQVTIGPPPSPDAVGAPRVTRVLGRSDDRFQYDDGVTVHPDDLRSAFTDEPSLRGYQLLQTSSGALARCVVDDPGDATAVTRIRARLLEALLEAGLSRPDVTIESPDRIEPLPCGKVQRFVALADGSHR
jgi:phenylacetate-coenzyme A ligase PaaK-like adenylate-forming protein